MTTPSGAIPRTRHALLIALLGSAAPALAQAPDPPADAAPPVATESAAPQGARTYTPADFTRFAPRNAFDMLSQVPASPSRTATPTGAGSARRSWQR